MSKKKYCSKFLKTLLEIPFYMNEVFVVINYLVRHVRRFDKFVIKKR